MSRIVEVDYENIACRCNAVCDLAEQRLDELDDLILKAEANATSVVNSQSNELIRQMNAEKERILNQINRVRSQANSDAKKGTISVDDHSSQYLNQDKIINEAKKLEELTNSFSSKKIVEFNALLDTLLKENINESNRKMFGNKDWQIEMNERMQKTIAEIDDEVLKQFIFIAFAKNSSLFGEELVKAGKALMAESVNATYDSLIIKEQERIRKEMEAARVDADIINKVVSTKENTSAKTLEKMQEQATIEIIDETIRRQSLKAIIKAVSDRGFIVDKKNIKIDRSKNEVNMVALKASGERADFKIYLDGKFIYDFHQGYKGQACQKDIEPFLNDLEEVYGIHIKKTEQIWENPDKVSTMKYQAMNTNKNRG